MPDAQPTPPLEQPIGHIPLPLDPLGVTPEGAEFSTAVAPSSADLTPSSDRTDTVLARFGDQYSPLIEALQIQLHALNYPVGTADGNYGQTTRAALLAYCANNNLPLVLNSLDAYTLDVILHHGVPCPLSPERINATAASPALAHSRQILFGRVLKIVGSTLLGLLGVTSTAAETPAATADYLTANYTNVLSRLAGLDQVANAVLSSKWMVALCLLTIIGSGFGFIWLRVEDHRTGANLGK